MIELQNLSKHFVIQKKFFARPAKVVKAVDGIDLTIRSGENLGLVGESGSGKTTLGRMILNLLPTDSGRLLFEGHDITRLSARQMRPFRQHVQMIFQDPYSSLDPRFTVRRSILEALIFDATRTKQQKEERVEELLAVVQLPVDSASRFPHEFSGGERQRIAIARALAMNPRLLVLDEAVSSLDVIVQEDIIKLLMDLQKKINITYLFISHNLRVIKKISAKIAVMYKGKIVELGSVDDIFQNSIHPYTRQLLAAAIEYRAPRHHFDIIDYMDEPLIEHGPGHWVRAPKE